MSAVREYLTGPIRNREHKRVVYDLLWVMVVLVYFAAGFPASTRLLTPETGLPVLLLAVLANVAYYAAYGAEVFAQMSGYGKRWRANCAIFLVAGLTFAGTITDCGRWRFLRPVIAS